MEYNSHTEEQKQDLVLDNQSPLLKETVQPKVYYAGFWMRFWAYLLDLLIIGSIDRIIVKPLFDVLHLSQEDGFFSPFWFVTALTFYGYFVLMTKYFGQTLGKMVFGLKVIHLHEDSLSWSAVLFREGIGRYISKTLLLIGYLLVAFLPKKQGIHDYYADTTVIHEGK
ncbi:RDD family protein [Priestia megaterium]|nr:RDD family protein [Priestia megaterium]